MKKVIIFDLDGTLLNTLNSIAFFGNTALEKFNFPTLKVSDYPQFIGKGAPYLIEKLYEYVGGDPDKYEEFFDAAMQIYNEYGNKNIVPYDDIDKMLDALRKKGVKCAVLSNKPHNITVEVCSKHFDGKFECVYGQRKGVAKKPDPYMIYEILKEIDASANDCIYCGDSEVDVITAKNANVFMAGAAWGFYGDKPFENADAILQSPLDILNYLD